MRVDNETFDQWLGKAYESLPERFRQKIEEHDVTVMAADWPHEDTSGDGAVTLGHFIGVPLPDQQGKYAAPSPRIVLYQRSFEMIFDDPERMEDRVRRTLLHEVGHFLGMDEPELHEIEERIYGSEDE